MRTCLHAAMYRALANLKPGEAMTRNEIHKLRCKYMGQEDMTHGIAATGAALDLIVNAEDSVYEFAKNTGLIAVRRV